MEWIKCSDQLPEACQQVLVNDLNGEGVLIAWRSLWRGSGGIPTGEWAWSFQVAGIEHEDVNIKEWCAYSEPTE
ncbi:DUF551 domain-containing protein [Pantoea sp. SIMBA_079]|uniref:DUF551 domain-containing protein n=1 Tax=Pantoea sp. SIMBA_079 TaxID=3085817 RepID=UPI003995F302